MEIFKIVAISIIAVLLITVLKTTKREDFSVILTIIASILLFAFAILKLEDVIELLNQMIAKSGINKEYLKLLIKVTGITYIIEIASNICKDAGSSALATKVEMLGKLSIVVLTIPIITSVVSVITEII